MIIEDLFNRIDSLSENGKQLVRRKIEQLLHNQTPVGSLASKRLVSYVETSDDFDKADLKEHLKNVLPDYMLPAEIVVLEDLPKLPNGKIDIKTLSSLKVKPSTKPAIVATNASSDVENKLVKIWEEVLNFSPIEITDNFFEIGGDSILSIQIIAKARKQGLEMAPNLLFEHQNIAQLALFVSETKTEETTKSELLKGDFELLPMHHWFFESHKNAPQHWNQASKISGKIVDDKILVEKSISHIVNQHDALRLSFSLDSSNWKAQFLPIDEIKVFQYFDLSDVQEHELEQKTKHIITELYDDLKLESGGLFKCIFFDYASEIDNCCVLLAHHLVVDAVSWQIITNDFIETLKIQREGSTELPSRQSTTINEWSAHLNEMATSATLNQELAYWENQIGNAKSLPVDLNVEMPILEKDVKVIDFTLDTVITNILLGQVNESFNIKIDEVLIAAFTETLSRWSGENEICLGLELHGRESGNPAIDLSNTVGWFTSYFPIALHFEKKSGLRDKIVSAKETLRGVPNGGIGYGILKYISKKIKTQSTPQVVFNYLGSQNSNNASDDFVCEPFNHGARSVKSERFYTFELNSFMMNGAVHFSLGYSSTMYEEDTIQKLVKSFKEVIAEIITLSKEGNMTNYSPSDFPEVDLNQDDLDSLLNDLDL